MIYMDTFTQNHLISWCHGFEDGLGRWVDICRFMDGLDEVEAHTLLNGRSWPTIHRMAMMR